MRGERWLWAEQLRVLVFPRRCPFCGRVLGFLTRCPDCEPELKQLKLMIPRLPDSEHCMEHLSGAAAVCRYDGCVREAILRMKNGGQGYCARELGVWMAAEIFGCTFRQQRGIIRLEQSPVLRRFDLVVPVPASGRERGYNLPDLLARQLAWALDTPLDCGALQKTRCTEKQEGKTARQRMENVKNAYRATNPAAVEGRRVLLVDDVITTGATLSNCAKALRTAGALDVFAVTLAETQFAR